MADTFKQDEEFTPVIFRMARKKDGGEVVALFPAEPYTICRNTCSCYVHVGQHGEADPRHVINTTRPATPEEYADLKKELEGRPYGYRLKVYQRHNRAIRKEHDQRVAEMRKGRAA